MLPVLEALRDEYAGRLNVVYLDVRQHRILAMRYHVRSIPTLVFCDKKGKEVQRHPGQLSERRIGKRLRELGMR